MIYRLIAAVGEHALEFQVFGSMVLGRVPPCDILIPDSSISRRHAELKIRDGCLIVRDLGSNNGTFHNGRPVIEAACHPGDEVKFGTVAFRFEMTSPGDTRLPNMARPVCSDERRRDRAVGTRDLEAALSADVAAVAIAKPLPADFSGLLSNSLSFKRQPVADLVDATSGERSAVSERLATLLEVSTELTRSATVDALLNKIVDKSWAIFPVDRIAILLADESGSLHPRVAIDRQGKELGQMVPQSIARAAFDQRQAILSKDAAGDRRFGGRSILYQQVRSAMCVPLVAREGPALGVLYVDTLVSYHAFTEDDLNFLIAFAGIASAAIEHSYFVERIRRESLVRSNFERFFTPGLAARIASSPEAVRLGGEKRPVAVLFSDIRGFTTLSEAMKPDEMAALLSEYFTDMVDCVFRYGGTLDKFIGDAVMAQWGAPLAAPDDVDRCMLAAIDMMRALDRLNRRWAEAGRIQLAIGIGLNYGEAFAGNIGSERRLEYTVIGDTVNTASRLCGAAAGGEILVSERFKAALRESHDLQSCPPMELKGKSDPLPVYRVVL